MCFQIHKCGSEFLWQTKINDSPKHVFLEEYNNLPRVTCHTPASLKTGNCKYPWLCYTSLSFFPRPFVLEHLCTSHHLPHGFSFYFFFCKILCSKCLMGVCIPQAELSGPPSETHFSTFFCKEHNLFRLVSHCCLWSPLRWGLGLVSRTVSSTYCNTGGSRERVVGQNQWLWRKEVKEKKTRGKSTAQLWNWQKNPASSISKHIVAMNFPVMAFILSP